MMNDLRYREFNSLKILHHIERLRALAKGQDVAPITIEIDPVAYCNHACSWCVDPIHYTAEMSIETYMTLITELADFRVNGFGIEGIVFKGGGEPTLHLDFGRMVEDAVRLGFSVGVVTNGSQLIKWADVIGTQTSYVRVSIDGPTPTSHKYIHRSKDFHKIIAGVKQLLRIRDKRRHPIVGLSFAMDIQTYKLAEMAIQLGERSSVDYILLRPPFFEEVGRKPTMTTNEAQQVRHHLQYVATSYHGPIDVLVGNWIGDMEQKTLQQRTPVALGRRDTCACSDLPIEHRSGHCLASPLLAVVTADGKLYGCCNLRALPQWTFGQLDYSAGNNFASLWHGPQRQKILTAMHQTACIQHCTHPLSRYNEMIEVLMDADRLHSQFI